MASYIASSSNEASDNHDLYKCKRCQFTAKNICKLITHITVSHTNFKPFTCAVCKSKGTDCDNFTSADEAFKHICAAHPDVDLPTNSVAYEYDPVGQKRVFSLVDLSILHSFAVHDGAVCLRPIRSESGASSSFMSSSSALSSPLAGAPQVKIVPSTDAGLDCARDTYQTDVSDSQAVKQLENLLAGPEVTLMSSSSDEDTDGEGLFLESPKSTVHKDEDQNRQSTSTEDTANQETRLSTLDFYMGFFVEPVWLQHQQSLSRTQSTSRVHIKPSSELNTIERAIRETQIMQWCVQRCEEHNRPPPPNSARAFEYIFRPKRKHNETTDNNEGTSVQNGVKRTRRNLEQ